MLFVVDSVLGQSLKYRVSACVSENVAEGPFWKGLKFPPEILAAMALLASTPGFLMGTGGACFQRDICSNYYAQHAQPSHAPGSEAAGRIAGACMLLSADI